MDAKRSVQIDSSAEISAHLEGFSLPGWIYRDADFLEAEKERVFLTSWQVICHLNDIPNPGDYHTLDFLGEPLVAVRGQDHGVKAFFNVCRHRAARLVDGGSGHCSGRIVCPYHAWTYDERVQTGMGSRSFTPGPLGRTEVALRSFARRIRELIPESHLDRAPGAGWHVRSELRKTRG